MSKPWSGTRTAWLAVLLAVTPVAAQDGNILEPIEGVERRLIQDQFTIVDFRGSRVEGDRTSRAALQFEDGHMMVVKWAVSAPGGEYFNNQPRYEAAAYEIQKLFLDERDYVVPPTVLRAFDRGWYETVEPDTRATFKGAESVLVTMQYWLYNVTGEDVFDEDRLETDTAYARHFGDVNILTYLIRHNDSNQGNLLISRDPNNPRVFAVDNGLAFSNVISDRGTRWRSIQVRRLPAHTIERLRQVTEEDLTRALETLVQFEISPAGTLERVPITENLSSGRGIRQEDGVIQLGLTEREIRDIWRRLRELLLEVDRGRYALL